MTKTLVGLFDDASQVKTLVHELEGLGLRNSDIRVTGGAAGIPQRYTADALALLDESGVDAGERDFYREALRRGSTVVAARVDEGDVQRVSDAMSRYDLVPFEDRYADYQARGFKSYDESAPRYTEAETSAEHDRYRRGEMAQGADEIRAKMVEERVRVGKRAVEGGGARLSTYVTTEQVSDTLNLRSESVHVEQVPTGERPATEADLADAFQERTIEMREVNEEAVVEKQAVVTGEVVMSKEAGTRQETVSEQVRKTNVEVEQLETTGRVGATTMGQTLAPTGTGTAGYDERTYRSHYDANYASAGSWDDFSPAYRYGYDRAGSYNGDWDGFEREMRSDYERQYGASTWDRVKGAVKHGFQSTRNAVTGGADGNRSTHR